MSRDDLRAGERRLRTFAAAHGDRLFDVAFVIAALCSAAILLYLGRQLTFYLDEWTFLDRRMDPGIDAWLTAFNQHWSLVPVIAYEVLYRVFGLGSYLPYLGLLILVHVVAAAGLYLLVSSLAGRPAGLAAAMVLLLLGPGVDDLLWAFQVSFVGSTACGVWALYVMTHQPSRGRVATVGGLLLLGVASSGVGLFFLAAAIALVVVDQSRRRYWPAALVVTLVYLAWYATFGVSAIGADGYAPSFGALVALPAYVIAGGGAVIGAATGLGGEVGGPLFVVSVAVVAWRWFKGSDVPPLVIAGIIGLLAEFVLIGLVRAHLGVTQAASSRYMYMGVSLAIISAAAAMRLPGTTLAAHRRLLLPIIAAAVVVLNFQALRAGRDFLVSQARESQAVLTLAERYRGTPSVRDDRSLFPMPTIGRLHEIFAGKSLSSVGSPPTPDEFDRALFRVVGGGFTVAPGPGSAGQAVPLEVIGQQGVRTVALSDGCLDITTTGTSPYLAIRVPDGGSVTVRSDVVSEWRAFLGRTTSQETNSTTFDAAGEPFVVSVPWLQDDADWLVRIDPPAGTQDGRLCGFGPPRPG